MPCPTCRATIHVLGQLDGRRHLHCPRCGTHVIEGGPDTPDHITAPAMVRMVRSAMLDNFDHRTRSVWLAEKDITRLGLDWMLRN